MICSKWKLGLESVTGSLCETAAVTFNKLNKLMKCLLILSAEVQAADAGLTGHVTGIHRDRPKPKLAFDVSIFLSSDATFQRAKSCALHFVQQKYICSISACNASRLHLFYYADIPCNYGHISACRQ